VEPGRATAEDVTIVVVPRERFSMGPRAIEHLYANTPPGFSLVCVEGNAPRRIARKLARLAEANGFELVRTDRFLSPNQARNLGLSRASTRYVVFIDNDCFVEPGWLDALVACAEDTGAWVVGPLSFEGDPAEQVIHMARGILEISEVDGKRSYSNRHTNKGERFPEVSPPLERTPSDYVEFHCVMARREAFDAIGPLDERLLSTREHLDFSLSVRRAGGSVWSEPASHVTYVTPPPLRWGDFRFFMRRWSETWNTASLRHFDSKWGFEDTAKTRLFWLAHRRLVALAPLRSLVKRVFGIKGQRRFDRVVLLIERPLNRLLFRLPSSVSH
jgi:GT2 family glycosyltransferase